jgi:hypothetical protein
LLGYSLPLLGQIVRSKGFEINHAKFDEVILVFIKAKNLSIAQLFKDFLTQKKDERTRQNEVH